MQVVKLLQTWLIETGGKYGGHKLPQPKKSVLSDHECLIWLLSYVLDTCVYVSESVHCVFRGGLCFTITMPNHFALNNKLCLNQNFTVYYERHNSQLYQCQQPMWLIQAYLISTCADSKILYTLVSFGVIFLRFVIVYAYGIGLMKP